MVNINISGASISQRGKEQDGRMSQMSTQILTQFKEQFAAQNEHILQMLSKQWFAVKNARISAQVSSQSEEQEACEPVKGSSQSEEQELCITAQGSSQSGAHKACISKKHIGQSGEV